MIDKVPFVPMGIERAKKRSKIFAPAASKILKLKPALISELAQLESQLTPVQYISVSFIALLYSFFLVLFFLSAAVYIISPREFMGMFSLIAASSAGFAFFIFVQALYYPRLLLKQKAAKLNKDLLFALRHLLIQIRSGVPLYNAMVSISEADYGVVSQEFRRAAKEISGGTPQIDALDNMVMRTPSIYLRRAIWQISNALRAGSDLAVVIEILVKEFTEEERVNLQRFSKELSPWALLYLMLTVIFPTMGIATVLVLTTLAPITISSSMFVFFTLVFVFFQFFFIKFLKNKRPIVRF